MTYHERKAKALGLGLNEDEIRLLFFIWASCPAAGYFNFMASNTCFATGQFLLISLDLENKGFLEAKPNDQASVRLTASGLKAFYDLQS